MSKKVAKTIGTPKCNNKVLVTCPSAPKIAHYFKALGGTLNTKANPTAGMAAKSISSSKFSKNIYYPTQETIFKRFNAKTMPKQAPKVRTVAMVHRPIPILTYPFKISASELINGNPGTSNKTLDANAT